MSDVIPDDVMDAAMTVADEVVRDMVPLIARAIMAERERCARIAEEEPIQYWEDKRDCIVKAIRRGSVDK